MKNTLETIVDKLLLVPSIKTAIDNGDYTEIEARLEFYDQISECDVSCGLALVDDIPEMLMQDIIQIVG